LDLTDRQMQYMHRRKPGEDAGAVIGPPSFTGSEIDMLAASNDLKILAPGAPIYMPSYSLLYDKSSERPVMRGGIVSSDPESDCRTADQEPARRVLFQTQSAEGASAAPFSRSLKATPCFSVLTQDILQSVECLSAFPIASRPSASANASSTSSS
jgi:hypothetical protein